MSESHETPEINPYNSPGVDAPAVWSTFEARILQAYLRYRDRPPSLGSMLISYLPSWAIRLLLFSLLILVGFYLSDSKTFKTTLAVAASAFALGTYSRDVAYMRAVVRTWPVLESIIDWSRAQELASDANG